MRKSSIILIIGLVILAVGAALSVAKIEPWADYVLLVGAAVVIIRGFIRNHEKDDRQE
jgi:positive regulator of sigma E activity